MHFWWIFQLAVQCPYVANSLRTLGIINGLTGFLISSPTVVMGSTPFGTVLKTHDRRQHVVWQTCQITSKPKNRQFNLKLHKHENIKPQCKFCWTQRSRNIVYVITWIPNVILLLSWILRCTLIFLILSANKVYYSCVWFRFILLWNVKYHWFLA